MNDRFFLTFGWHHHSAVVTQNGTRSGATVQWWTGLTRPALHCRPEQAHSARLVLHCTVGPVQALALHCGTSAGPGTALWDQSPYLAPVPQAP